MSDLFIVPVFIIAALVAQYLLGGWAPVIGTLLGAGIAAILVMALERVR